MIAPALLADAVLLVHAAYVLFVVAGQVLILAGWAGGWAWPRNPWFRWLHLAAIGLVVAEVALGVYCPLTIIEVQLREAAGQLVYGGSFVAHWVGRVLYHDVPLWQTHVAYVAFAVVTAWSFLRYPPRRFRRCRGGRDRPRTHRGCGAGSR